MKKFNKILFPWYVMFFITYISVSCAKVGSPTGGPTDIAPPVLINSNPAMSSTGFSGNEIEIEFNEYIQLKEVYDEVLISPPLAGRPVITARSRSVFLEFNDTLLDNTTYTINFGNSIADNNEGNPVNGFEFVFSTGATIDSLAVTGSAVSAFDGKPPLQDDKVYIMLYENLSDSAPFLELPRYIGRVNTLGLFSVHNMHSGTFRPLILKDTDGDMMYNPVTDAIGFTDSMVVITPGSVTNMTFTIDTFRVNDSLVSRTETLDAVSISMDYFNEVPSRVFLNNKSRQAPERLFFTFTRPPYDTVTFTPVNFEPSGPWYVKEASPMNDSISLWITDSSLINTETLEMLVSYTTVDSAGNFIVSNDSVILVSRIASAAATSRRREERQEEEATEDAGVRLSLTSSLAGRKEQNLNAPVRFTSARPVQQISDSLVVLEEIRDTLRIPRDFNVIRDSNDVRHFSISAKWQSAALYSLTLLPGAVTDIYGASNDTLQTQFRAMDEESYGNLILTLESEEYPLIIQLLNEKGLVVKQMYARQAGPVNFNYMLPGNYTLKAIHDGNGNGRWDTGNYLLQIQPEKVHNYVKPFTVRSNWDYDISWQLND